ncbi:hypothetical protein IV102_14070 [bacterium]|nr:hypothetical protein [bacterium]
MSAHGEIFQQMASLLSGKQQMAILGRRKSDWEVMFNTGTGWEFAPGSLRLRVLKEAEAKSEAIVVMDTEKDDRFVDSKPPFRSCLCIPILIPGRLPVMVFAEEPEKIMSFNFNKMPAWEGLVNRLRDHLPEIKSVTSAARKSPEIKKAASPPSLSLAERFSQALKPDGSDEKVEINWRALITVIVLLLGFFAYMVKSFLQSREEDRLRMCSSNLATIATAARMYARDNHGRYPRTLDLLTERKYLENMPRCPASGSMTYTDYVTNSKPPAVTVSCVGGHHRKLFKGSGSPESFPFYSSIEAFEQAKKSKHK